MIHRGFVVSDSTNDPAKTCKSFLAQITVLNHPNSIRTGYTPVLHIHTAQIACRFDNILSTIDRKSGAVIEEEPQSIKRGDCALVLMVPQNEVCVETFAEYPALGRFVVRDLRQTIAVGIIKSEEKLNQPISILNTFSPK